VNSEHREALIQDIESLKGSVARSEVNPEAAEDEDVGAEIEAPLKSFADVSAIAKKKK
jgi:hypothetical protein